MSNVVEFRPRKRANAAIPAQAVIYKEIDGRVIQCVNVDALTASERNGFLTNAAPWHDGDGAAFDD